MKQRPTLATVVGAGFLGLAALAALPQTGDEATDRRATPVRVAIVAVAPRTRDVRFPGVVQATRRAALAFAVPGDLASRPVSAGDRVQAGQLLAALDDREYRNALDAASAALAEIEARLAQGERDLARVANLQARKAATTEEREQVAVGVTALRAARDAAAARRDETRRLLAESALRAPWDGTVTAVHAEPGEYAAPGRPVVEVAGDGGLEVAIELPESVLGRLAAGTAVTVALPLAGAAAPGVVRAVAAASPGAGRLFAATVTLDEAGARAAGAAAGMAAEVLVPVAQERALVVPLAALLNPGGSRPAVMRVRGGRAEEVPVTPGRVLGGTVPVAGGLAAGDTVVVAGHTRLMDGDAVEVR